MNLLELTIQGGVLIAAILLLRALLRYRLPGWTFRLLWGVALVRLLVPVALPFSWNIYSGLEHLAPPDAPVQATPGGILSPVLPEFPAEPLPPQTSHPLPTQAAPAATAEIPWLTLLWLAGAIILAALFLISYWRCLKIFRTALPLTHPAVNQWRRRCPALRGVPIRQCDQIRTPLTYGLHRPVVLLPKGLSCDDQAELGYILLHEGAHIQNQDAWWKIFLALALCVHWFNPLVWCMYVCASRDLERCCDERVVRTCGLECRSDYALTLLKWEERRSCPHPLYSSFSNKIMKERVISIMKLKKQSAAALALALILVVGTTVTFATSPVPESENRTPVSQSTDTSAPTTSPAGDGTSQLTDSFSAPEQTPAPETETELLQQDQTTAPAAEPEEVPAQTPEEPQPPEEVQIPETQVPSQTEPTLAEKYQIPEGYIEDGTTFTVANDAEYEELTKYLYALDSDLNFKVYENQDGSRRLEVYRRSTHAQDMQNEWLENGDYKKNKHGETYGSSLLEATVGYRPDLIAVIATDTGVSGFVDSTVMNGWYGYPYVSNGFPDDVGKYMDWLKTQPAERHLPVYDVDHETVVGTYIMYNDQSEDYVKSQEDIEFEVQAVTEMMQDHGYSQEEIDAYIQQMKADYAR